METFEENQNTPQSPRHIYWWFAGGFIAGAAASYFLDPDRGHRRRILLRDQILSQSHQIALHTQRGWSDINNRLRGFLLELNARRNAPYRFLDDDTLNQRVRAAFGRKVSHARSIQSHVSNGVVTLAGPILAKEVKALLRCVKKVVGVQGIVNRLEVHKDQEKVSALQGTGPQYLQ